MAKLEVTKSDGKTYNVKVKSGTSSHDLVAAAKNYERANPGTKVTPKA